MTPEHRERLLDRRWRLMNNYDGNPFHDGLVTQKIAEIDAQLASDLPQLTDQQKAAILAAAQKEGGGYRVSSAQSGARGLVGKGLIFGASDRRPGMLGTLTREGERVRAALLS